MSLPDDALLAILARCNIRDGYDGGPVLRYVSQPSADGNFFVRSLTLEDMRAYALQVVEECAKVCSALHSLPRFYDGTNTPLPENYQRQTYDGEDVDSYNATADRIARAIRARFTYAQEAQS